MGYLDLGKNYATYGVAGHDDDSVNYRFMQLMFLIANCAATVFHNDNNDDHTVKACAPRAFFSCATSEVSVDFETIRAINPIFKPIWYLSLPTERSRSFHAFESKNIWSVERWSKVFNKFWKSSNDPRFVRFFLNRRRMEEKILETYGRIRVLRLLIYSRKSWRGSFQFGNWQKLDTSVDSESPRDRDSFLSWSLKRAYRDSPYLKISIGSGATDITLRG